MPAFKSPKSIRDDIRGAVTSLAERCRMHVRQDMTMDDVMELVIRPEDRDLIRQASTLVQNDSAHVWLPSGVNIIVYAGSAPWAPLMPAYCRKKADILAGPETAAHRKFDRIVSRYRQIAEEFGLVMAVFEALNERCATPAVVRYFFEGILPLLKLARHTDKADALATLKAPREFPSLPPSLRSAAVTADGLIARALLYPSTSSAPVPSVSVGLDSTFEIEARIPWDPAVPLPRV